MPLPVRGRQLMNSDVLGAILITVLAIAAITAVTIIDVNTPRPQREPCAEETAK